MLTWGPVADLGPLRIGGADQPLRLSLSQGLTAEELAENEEIQRNLQGLGCRPQGFGSRLHRVAT